MKIALITDAWQPQVNGVVTTLVELVAELEKFDHQFMIIHRAYLIPGLALVMPVLILLFDHENTCKPYFYNIILMQFIL